MFNRSLNLCAGSLPLLLLLTGSADSAAFDKPSFTTFTAGGGAEFDSASGTLFVDPANH